MDEHKIDSLMREENRLQADMAESDRLLSLWETYHEDGNLYGMRSVLRSLTVLYSVQPRLAHLLRDIPLLQNVCGKDLDNLN